MRHVRPVTWGMLGHPSQLNLTADPVERIPGTSAYSADLHEP